MNWPPVSLKWSCIKSPVPSNLVLTRQNRVVLSWMQSGLAVSMKIDMRVISESSNLWRGPLMSIEATEASLIEPLRSGAEFPEKTLVDLEFFRIIDELSSYTMTQEARELIGKRLFFVHQEELELVEDLIAEILDVQNRKPGSPREGSPVIGSIIEGLSQPASILDLESLYALGLYLSNTYTIAEYYLDESLENPLIRRLLTRLPDLRRLQ